MPYIEREGSIRSAQLRFRSAIATGPAELAPSPSGRTRVGFAEDLVNPEFEGDSGSVQHD